MNVFFWPTKALDRPDPLETTLLASEENLGKELRAPPIAIVLESVSTRTEDVSWRLSPAERRGPAGEFKDSEAQFIQTEICTVFMWGWTRCYTKILEALETIIVTNQMVYRICFFLTDLIVMLFRLAMINCDSSGPGGPDDASFWGEFVEESPAIFHRCLFSINTQTNLTHLTLWP